MAHDCSNLKIIARGQQCQQEVSAISCLFLRRNLFLMRGRTVEEESFQGQNRETLLLSRQVRPHMFPGIL